MCLRMHCRSVGYCFNDTRHRSTAFALFRRCWTSKEAARGCCTSAPRRVPDRLQLLESMSPCVRAWLRTVSLQGIWRQVGEDVRHRGRLRAFGPASQRGRQPHGDMAAGTSARAWCKMGIGLCGVRESAMEALESQEGRCGWSHAPGWLALRHQVGTIGSESD